MKDKLKVLFVDDQSNVLDGLRRMLRPKRKAWDMKFVDSGRHALEALDTDRYDIVVSDMRMPGLNGYELLSEVKDKHPESVRMILSGHSDDDLIKKSVLVAHQFLAKPCEAEHLTDSIDRALNIREAVSSDALRKAAETAVLPSLPKIYQGMIEELSSDEASVDRLAHLIEQDLSMTAKVMQIINSAFFGISYQKVATVTEAVQMLGLDVIRALVFGIHIFEEISPKVSEIFPVESFWKHAIGTANRAHKIASAMNCDPKVIDYAFISGLLHDIGSLLLAVNYTEEYQGLLREEASKAVPLSDLENDHFGFDHGQIGGYLIGLWGLPDEIVEAIIYHHKPAEAETDEFTALSAVHIAEVIDLDINQEHCWSACPKLDMDYLETHGVADRIDEWKEANDA